MIVAFLASQRSLHVLQVLGLGEASNAAGMSFLTVYPTNRRVMLLIALVMAGVSAHPTPTATGPKSDKRSIDRCYFWSLTLVDQPVWRVGRR